MKYLNKKELYEQAIESTFDKRISYNRIYKQIRKDQPSILWISYRKTEFIKNIVKSIKKEEFEFNGAKLAVLKIGDKERNLCQFSYKDFILLKVLNDIFNELSKKTFSKTLYSYRKKISRLHAVNDFVKFLKINLKEMKEKKYPLYVYKADINQYVENIPMDNKSLLWDIIKEELQEVKDEKEKNLLFKYFQEGSRMFFIKPKKFCKNIGTLFGSPLSNYIYNIYLKYLDKEFEEKQVFYARYGDDLLLAHKDKEVLLKEIKRIKKIIKKYRLEIKKAKEEYILFSGAGFKKDDLFEGANYFKYLGYEIHFDGSYTLPNKKVRLLLKDIDRRCRNTSKIIKDLKTDEKGEILASVINEVTKSFMFKHHYAEFLVKSTNNRNKLKELDYLLARRLLKFLFGKDSVKNFRKVSYKKIREVYGLKSLVVERNKN